ncbi:MAG: type II toxin-antitoxin system Phd/YefM family antitoxin [Polaromonas sp.]
MLTVSSMDAQNRFGQLLDTVQREPVTITRHGRTAAFIVSPQDMADLQDVKAKRTQAVQWFEAFFAQAEVAKSSDMRAAARQLTDAEVVRMVKELR